MAESKTQQDFRRAVKTARRELEDWKLRKVLDYYLEIEKVLKEEGNGRESSNPDS